MQRSFWPFVTIFYAFWACVCTYPVVCHLYDHYNGPLDAWLGTYMLNYAYQYWHEGGFHVTRFADGLIFYPAHYTVGMSETLLGDQLAYSLLMFLSRHPVASYNLLIICSLWFNALALCGLLYLWLHSRAAAFIGGLVFGFAPSMTSQANHVQMVTFWWAPLSLLCLYLYLERGQLRHLALAALFFVIQFASSVYLGIYLLTSLGIVFLLNAGWKPLWQTIRTKPLQLFIIGCFSAFVLAFICYPQYMVKVTYATERTTAENIFFSADINSFFSVFPFNYLYADLEFFKNNTSPDFPWEKYLFVGFVPMLWALIAICSYVYRSRIGQGSLNRRLRDAIVLFLITLIFCLGPELKIHGKSTGISLPYKFIVEHITLFKAMRVSARWGMPMTLWLGVLAGASTYILLNLEFKKWRVIRALFIPISFGAIAIEQINRPLTLAEAKITALDYKLVAILSDRKHIPRRAPGVIFWPGIDVDAGDFDEMFKGFLANSKHALLATYFKRPIVNGFSGYFPIEYYETFRLGRKTDSATFLNTLLSRGIGTIVIDKRFVSERHPSIWNDSVLNKLHESEDFIVGNIKRPRK